MHSSGNRNGQMKGGSFLAALLMLTFGFSILAFLVSIEHPEWFHLRPMTGAAIAMSHASDIVSVDSGAGH